MHLTICYLKWEDKTLMLHKTRPNDLYSWKWVAPGGVIEPGETIYKATKREIGEETGYIIKSAYHIGTVNIDNTEANLKIKKDFSRVKLEVLVSNEFEGRIRDPPEGHLNWVSNSIVPMLLQRQGDPIIWHLTNKYKMFQAHFKYRGTELCELYYFPLNLNRNIPDKAA